MKKAVFHFTNKDSLTVENSDFTTKDLLKLNFRCTMGIVPVTSSGLPTVINMQHVTWIEISEQPDAKD